MAPPLESETISIAPRNAAARALLLFGVVISVLGALQVYWAINGGWVVWWVLGGLAIPVGLFALYVGLRNAFRRRPVLVADSTGVCFTLLGCESMLPWGLIAGFEIVGSESNPVLAITVIDADAALPHVHKSLRSNTLKLNKKHNLTAAAYFPTHMLEAEPDHLLQQLRALALSNIPPLDASMPSSPSPSNSSLPSPLR